MPIEYSNYVENLTPAVADGTEFVAVSKDGDAAQLTTQQIANLGGGVHFRGAYLTLVALQAAVPTGEEGDYADVNEVGATDVVRYIWDEEEAEWKAGGAGGGVSSVSGTADRITSSGGATPAIDISATFEALLQKKVNAAVVLTDGATIDLTAIKHTLATALGRTFTISYTGDDITIEITLSATNAIMTFPAAALCISEGVATGDNTLLMSGASGDKYIIAIKKVGSAYYVICKNFKQ